MNATTQFLTPALHDDEEEVEQSLRPRRLDEFVGQARIKEQLAIALDAAKGRGEALDHVLLVGPPGLGKTSLAHIIREELGVGIRSVAGPALERKDVAAILTAVEARDVVFVDEIHRLSRAAEEILYPALEDFRLDIVMGQGTAARTLTLDLPPFTLVGATTRTGLLTSPLRDRFGITFRLDYYEDGELATIVRRSAGILGVEIADEAADEIAGRARGTPRVGNRILRRVRDVAEVRHQGAITTAIAREALELLEVDEAGLERLDRELLRSIAEKYAGGSGGSCGGPRGGGPSAPPASPGGGPRRSRAAAGWGSARWRRRSARSRTRSSTCTSRTSCSSASSRGRLAAARSPPSAAPTSARALGPKETRGCSRRSRPGSRHSSSR